MKDATGELSMTAVAVVAIAGIAALFGAFVFPTLKKNVEHNAKCNQAACNYETCQDGFCTCNYVNDEGEYEEITCPDQGGARE